jgi:aspartate kinase
MGKTTNGLERVLDAFYEGRRDDALAKLQEIIDYHDGIIADLWQSTNPTATPAKFYAELTAIVNNDNPHTREYEAWYDLIVGYGELLSTAIVSDYLATVGIVNRWVDMREVFITSARHRDANIDMERSSELLKEVVASSDARIFIGQGFIGATPDGAPTTIGREGSDYSAAVAGHILDAESVAIWKDVDGILNGDP